MHDLHLSLAAISFLILVLGFLHLRLKRSPISEPMVALSTGVVMGPAVLDWLDIHRWGSDWKTLETAGGLTLAVALMSTAFRIPKRYPPGHVRLQSALLLPGMLGMCAVSAALIHFIAGYSWLMGFMIGAVLTPTDPVLSSTIISGETAKRLLPDRIRHALSFESGANDGLAFPLVLLALLLLTKPSGQAWMEWLLKPLLWQTGGGVLFGLLIGYGGARFFLKAKSAGWTSEDIMLPFALTLGLFTYGFLELIRCNGIIAVFAAGCAANRKLSGQEDMLQDKAQDSLERLFLIPVFFLFGLALPWRDWQALGWKAAALSAGMLLLKRLPVIYLLGPALKPLSRPSDLFMVGWFGPMGVAAIYYMAHVFLEAKVREPFVVGSLVVALSIVVHGCTAYPFAALYARLNGRGKPPDSGSA